MNIEILLVAFNRLGYTKQTVGRLLSDPSEDFALTIWDNGSTDGTREYLDSLQDPRIIRKVMSPNNVYLTGAANDCFGRSSADLVGLVADDILVTPGWTRPLAQAHREIQELGFVGSWYLGKDLFDEARARHKIHAFGQHRILRHPFTGGGAGLVKLKTWKECGPFDGIATVNTWVRMAQKGYVNGFYVPMIPAEHMDYPWSEYFIPSESGEISVIRQRFGITTVEEWRRHHASIVASILDGPWDVKYYTGWRSKLRKFFSLPHRVHRRLAQQAARRKKSAKAQALARPLL